MNEDPSPVIQIKAKINWLLSLLGKAQQNYHVTGIFNKGYATLMSQFIHKSFLDVLFLPNRAKKIPLLLILYLNKNSYLPLYLCFRS